MSERVEFLCGHCRCVCATATGEWDNGALGDTSMLICEECARCDKAPPCTPLLDAVLARGLS
jgi:hypothetical protein